MAYYFLSTFFRV